MARSTSAQRKSLAVAALCGALAASPTWAFDQAAAERILQVARTKLARTATQLPVGQYPRSSLPDGTWLTVPATQMTGWTQGFFPGELWLLYDESHAAEWRTRADTWTRPLEVQQHNRQTHDLGFKFMPSYGLAYGLTNDPYDKQVLLAAAGALASRFNPRVGVISCCDWNPHWHLPMVSDTMMNLELLLWASQNGGPDRWQDMALLHALKALEDLVRPNGSTYHFVDYDPVTGARLSRGTYQGYSNESTWSRGQAWAVYGFTVVYRYTRDPRMLAAAQKVTDYYLSRLPPDGVPNWDFDAPSAYKDSSAAAAVASALLELSDYVPDGNKQVQYWNAALRMLDTLASPAYLATTNASPGLLLHGVGHLPAGQEVDVSLVYGDYYLLEAVRRFQRQTRPPSPSDWHSRRDFGAATHELGGGHTGIQTAEFDVTPLRAGLDSVIGYADSSTPVTAVSQLSMLLRMNPSGFFDVRNGATYAATQAVPYQPLSTYHVRLVANLPAGQYSVWVTPPGGAELLLADRFAFHTGAPPIDDLGKVLVTSGLVDDEYRVSGHKLGGSAAETWLSRSGFFAATRSLGPGHTGTQVAEFDVTPRIRPLDGVIGYADGSVTVTSRTDLAVHLRLSPAGVFDACDGPRYAAVNVVPYAAGTSYHVRVEMDLAARRFSVWIRPPGGTEVLLANRYAFRSGAPATDDLGRISLKSRADGDFSVTSHRLRSAPALLSEEVGEQKAEEQEARPIEARGK